MFILHSSNKTENLLTHLTSVIENMPLSNPLNKETFLIQSQGMERWLSQQLASQFGVWGNYEFLFPGKFFSSFSQKIDAQINDELFSRESMLWRFDELLRDLSDDCFKSLRHYIEGDKQNLKRFQLAQQLAQIFDQYQMMRPDMLDLWEQGQQLYQSKNEIWQRILWQRITHSIGGNHRGSLWKNVIKKLNRCRHDELSKQLPERIFIFGLNTMPPLFLEYLQALSRHCDVHLFLLNPAQAYWADLANKKHLSETLEGHPLLSALGQQGREFQQILLEQANFDYDLDSFEQTSITNNLQQLQNDILDNQLQERTLEKDSSISIHACHSKIREVEVLKNQLLFSLEQDSDLELRDIVIMAPDIQLYAPFISAIFNDIQHSIADKSLRLSNSALDAFIRFLTLSQSRFGWQNVMDLLEQSVIYSNFSLSESDLEQVKHWVVDTHVRWGKSAEHKKELGLPELTQNTWQATLDRLLMGYAIGSEDDFIDGILPYKDIEGSSAQALGGFNAFLQLLFKASDEFKHPIPLTQWADRLYYYADQLLSIKTSTEQLERQQLNQIFEELASTTSKFHTADISLDVMSSWLESRVSESKSSNGFLRGQLTFCSMLPMRSIPFKVIALLGINDREFPKTDQPPTFDLIGQNFRLGDRSRRADDRYQFLEVLLSARQQLIITYQGLSIQNNDDIPPSVVISELVDVLENYYQLTELITKHPLQSFSYQYFIKHSELFNYSLTDYETASALHKDKLESEAWWQGKLEPLPLSTIDINDLFIFYRQPQQYFLQKKLGIRLTHIEESIEEREPFVLNNLDTYEINQQWIEHNLKDSPFSLKKLQAQGRWLSGTSGKLAFDKQSQLIDEFSDSIRQYNLGNAIEGLPIDITVDSYRLVGTLNHLYEKGSLFYRYANLKGKDFMQAWLHHLIIGQVKPQNTHLLGIDDSKLFISTDSQPNLLTALIKIYLQGQEQPNAFFTEPAFAYIKQVLRLSTSKQAKKPAITIAQEQLTKELEYDRSLKQLYQNVEDYSEVLNNEFEDQCIELLLPTWQSLQDKS